MPRPLLAFAGRARRARFLREGAHLSIGSATAHLVGALQGILAARLLGPSGFGAVALLVALPTVVFAVFDARSDVTTIKFLSRYLASGDTLRSTTVCRLGIAIDLAVGACTCAVVVAISALAPTLLPNVDDAGLLVCVYAASLIVLGLQPTSTAILSALDRFDLAGRLEAGLAVLRLVVVAGSAITYDSPASVLLAYALSNVGAGIISIVVASRLYHSRTAGRLRRRGAPLGDDRRHIIRFLTLSNLSELASLPFKQLDVLLVGNFLSVPAAGQFKLAKSVTHLLTLPIAPLQTVLYRRLVAEPAARGELLRKVRRFVCPTLAAGVLAGSGLLAFVAPVLAGEAFSDARGPILAWGAGFALWSMLWWLRPVYLAEGRLGSWLALNAIASVGFVAGAWLAISADSGVTGFTVIRSFEPIVVVYLGALWLHRRSRRAELGPSVEIAVNSSAYSSANASKVRAR